MLRRYDWLLAGVVFAVFAVMAVHIARTMPVFNPIDELEHFDYAVKLAKGKAPQVSDLLEPEVLALWKARSAQADGAYMNLAPRPVNEGVTSYQAYHPSLAYRLAALVPGVGTADEGSLMLLRLICAGLLIGSRVLIYLALRRVSPAIALGGLAYLGLMVPVDILRFSNDAPAMFLGAVTFLLFVRHATAASDQGGGMRLAGIALALLATCAVKVTGIVFLIPALGLGIACLRPWEEPTWRRSTREMLIVLLPALIFAAVFIAGNLHRDGTFSGTAHLKALGFAPPPSPGLRWDKTIPYPNAWSFQHQLLFQTETKIWGIRAGEKTIFYAAGVAEIGWVLAWGFGCFGFAEVRTLRLGIRAGAISFLRGQVLAGSILLLYLVEFTALMVFGMGGVNWAGRQDPVVEGALILPLAGGWAWACAGEGRGWKMARIGIWIVAAGTFFSLTRHYLKF